MSKLRLLSSLLAELVKSIAEGDKNAPLTKIYWWLAGKKTWLSIGLFALYAFLSKVLIPVFTQCGDPCGATPEMMTTLQSYIDWIPRIAETLLAFGLFDAAVRIEPPKQAK